MGLAGLPRGNVPNQHLATTGVLTPEQARRYGHLSGYGRGQDHGEHGYGNGGHSAHSLIKRKRTWI